MADGLERLTREKGAALLLSDAVHSLVVERLSGDMQAYWHAAGPHALVGMIRNQPEVAELLRTRGILAWMKPVSATPQLESDKPQGDEPQHYSSKEQGR